MGAVEENAPPRGSACPSGRRHGTDGTRGEPSEGRLARRATALAHVLSDLGIRPGNLVIVACCGRHADHAAVAHAAARAIGAEPRALTRTAETPPRRPQLVLSCAEGHQWWTKTGLRARELSDVPGTLWWRALEGRALAEMRAQAGQQHLGSTTRVADGVS